MGFNPCRRHVEILSDSLSKYHKLESDAIDLKKNMNARIIELRKIRSELLSQAGDVDQEHIREIVKRHNKLADGYIKLEPAINKIHAIKKKIVHEYFENHLKGMVLSPKLLDYASLYDYDIVGKSFDPESASRSPTRLKLFAEEIPRRQIRDFYEIGRKKYLDSTHDNLVNSLFVKNAEKKYHSEYFKYMLENNLMRK